MNCLATADIHLTSNPRDEYRWGLFPWLRKQIKGYDIKELLLLGDLTDAKDKHPASLVNRLAGEVNQCVEEGLLVYILRGNHDYINIDNPFFAFLEMLPRSRVRFIREPLITKLSIGNCVFLPNTRDYQKDWGKLQFKGVDYVFTHQTYTGAETENGTKLTGVPSELFAKFDGQVWSGDIHVPQRIGKNIQYVGAPYRLRFGDSFTPRVVCLGTTRNGKPQSQDLRFPTTNKELVVIKRLSSLERMTFEKGTQVKVRMEMHRADFPTWKERKQEIIAVAAKKGWDLTGPELVALPDDRAADDEVEALAGSTMKPVQVLKRYAKVNKLNPDLKEVGLELLKSV